MYYRMWSAGVKRAVRPTRRRDYVIDRPEARVYHESAGSERKVGRALMRGSGRGVVLALGVGCAVLASGCDNSGDVVRLAFRTRAEEGSFEYRLL